MTARTMRVLVLGAMLCAGAALAQAPGTPGAGGTGSSGTGTTGSGTATGGATGSGRVEGNAPAAAAAARLFCTYRVPGAASADTSGIYRVDTGASPPAAGSGGSSASTSSTATTNTTTSTGSSAAPSAGSAGGTSP